MTRLQKVTLGLLIGYAIWKIAVWQYLRNKNNTSSE